MQVEIPEEILNQIFLLEQGELEDTQIVNLFINLYNKGILYRLQPQYNNFFSKLVDSGKIKFPPLAKPAWQTQETGENESEQ